MTKIQIYMFEIGKKENGTIRTMKEGADFERFVVKMHLKGIGVIKTKKISAATIQKKYENDGQCYAVDGCETDADSVCEHGFPSFMKLSGWI